MTRFFFLYCYCNLNTDFFGNVERKTLKISELSALKKNILKKNIRHGNNKKMIEMKKLVYCIAVIMRLMRIVFTFNYG